MIYCHLHLYILLLMQKYEFYSKQYYFLMKIYIFLPILSPTQLEYPSFGELDMSQWGKMYGGGRYVRISYYLCAVEILSLYTIDHC